MQRSIFIFILQLFIILPALAQGEKVPLSHDDYDGWKSAVRQQFSPDERWLSYEINPQRGDGWFYLKDLRNNTLDSIPRGTRASFSPGGDYVAFIISPQTDKVRQARVEGKSRDEMPRDSLGIVMLSDMSDIRVEGVRSFSTAREESDWMVYHKERDRSGEKEGNRSQGTTLVVFNPLTNEEHEFSNVVEYDFSENGKYAGFIQKENNGEESRSVVKVFNTQTQSAITLLDEEGKAQNITLCSESDQAAFIFAGDSGEEPPVYDLYRWEEDMENAYLAVDASCEGMPSGWSVSEHTSIWFGKNGSRMFFGTAPAPGPEPEDTLLSDEKYRVDIWHYEDPLIQPQQLVEADREKRRTYTAVYHADRGEMVQLADKEMPEISITGESDIQTGRSVLPYRIQNSFESGEFADIYLVDLNTGERTMELEKHRGSVHRSTLGNARLSEEGDYLIWFSQADSNWHAMSVDNRTRRNITEEIPYPLYDEDHDTPSLPGPYGIGPWVEGDRYVLVYDRYDIWKVDPSGDDSPVSLTNGYGRENGIRLRYVDPSGENTSLGSREEIMLSAFNENNKQSGFYNIRVHRPGNPSQVVMDDVRYFTPQLSQNGNLMVWQRSTFSEYPDLWVSEPDFADKRKVSNANPQQEKFRWGDARLVEWVSFSNDTLQGIFYTPGDLDPNKEYPLIVYFYERMSHNLHRYYTPSPGGSPSINVSYYVSNGYIVFVPDINPYIIGYPGKTAYNSIVSGTKAMLNKFDFIDRDNLGLSGQSWGGYQISHLITETDMFSAAAAGAPVSNMFSAYGGIRWSTGLSRIYQYEETQSRIGGTIWEKPLRYLENSPIFFADKIDTPLFMMHNDDDGAVPWYQGIEFYMALRRLGKPVWMLNYNDEAHGVRRRPNRMDLTIRLQQFFDHYLKGEPAPVWMKEGIPAIQKGKIDGYEPAE